MSKRPYHSISLLDAFEYHTHREPNSGCWLWAGPILKYRGGYGVFTMRSENIYMVRAHRLSWKIYCHPITKEQHVLHSCDNVLCVNPEHLFLGDQDLNMKDAAFKGRQTHSTSHPKYIHGKYVGQKQNPNYKHPLN